MNTPKSFMMVLNRRYRVYFNPQTGFWYTAFNDGDGRGRVSLGVKTRPEAEAAVMRLDAPRAAEPAREPVLWSLIQSGFIAHKVSTGRAKNTITRYTGALDAFTRFLASKKIERADEITLSVLEGFIGFRTAGDEDADEKTAYTDALVIKGAMKWAAKPARKLLVSNPALDWETPEPVKPKRRTYKAEEVAALESGVRRWLRPIITTLAWTGMRIDELANLRWQDIDLISASFGSRFRKSGSLKAGGIGRCPCTRRLRRCCGCSRSVIMSSADHAGDGSLKPAAWRA